MGDTSKKKILLGDDHRLLAEGLQALLQSDFEMTGIVEDGWALVRATLRLRPDLVIADVGMPRLSGIEALRRLRRLNVTSKMLMLTMHMEINYVVAALREGAAGYVLKSSASSELRSAIDKVFRGGTYLSPRFADLIPGYIDQFERIPGAIGRLTPRQREVLQLIAEGQSSKEIASTLQISLKTVEFHRTKIMEALNIHSVAGLTRYAITEGIVTIP